MDRHNAARELHGGQTSARQDQPRGRRELASAARARRNRGDPAGQKGPRLGVALGIAGAQAEEARGGGAGQQDGPYHLGHDGERRDLPTSEGGLSPPTIGIEYTWHWQGQQQQDGDRSIRGSGQPGGPDGA